MFQRLLFILLAIGIALGPVGSYAHYKSHAGNEMALKSGHVSDDHSAKPSDHHHPTEPCKGKLSLDDSNCCSIGCQLVLGLAPAFILPKTSVSDNFDSPLTEQLDGTRPSALDPPPKA